jgi:UDP-glucose 4-epimerase
LEALELDCRIELGHRKIVELPDPQKNPKTYGMAPHYQATHAKHGGSMAILVTGGAGYIGSVTVDHLRSQGEGVVVLDNLARGHRRAVDAEVPFYQGDVGDQPLVAQIVREHEIESCIHFAALAYVAESVLQPQLYFENNVQKGIALVDSLLLAGVRSFVFSSTCATYGEPETLPIKEDSRQWPASPYGWSKLYLERLLLSYDKAYGLKFVALRYFNAAGATESRGEDHEPETHLIACVLQTASGKRCELPVFGNTYATRDGTAIRDYIHVSDLAEAHGRALDYLRRGGRSDFFNLGSGRGYSVMEVIECARRVTGKSIPISIEPPRPGDSTCLIADASKAQTAFEWIPWRSDLPTILRSAWDWQQRHDAGYATLGNFKPIQME